ncbi:MAG TPA: alpha/beta hydrolase [Myxococcales bacterium]|nr:alpha/beta hydrolase [Myxococcales bacterium]
MSRTYPACGEPFWNCPAKRGEVVGSGGGGVYPTEPLAPRVYCKRKPFPHARAAHERVLRKIGARPKRICVSPMLGRRTWPSKTRLAAGEIFPMELEIRPGPLGTRGGEPFPEVREEMARMQKARRVMPPSLMRWIPNRLIVKLMRRMMGFPNRDIATGKVATRHLSIPGPQGEIPVRIYTPEGVDLPILLYFHGGGWVGGSVDCVENIGRGIADRGGHIVVNVDYRLAPEHKFPAGLEDCYAAVEWAAQHASELGGDPTHLVVAGDSAGANFATVCCLLAHERGGPPISQQVLIYPGVDLSGRHDEEHGPQEGSGGMNLGSFMASVYVDRPEQLADPRCSPWLAKDVSFMPPALILTAEYCFIRDQGEAYAKKLAAEGVTTRVIRYNGLNHAFLDKVGVWDYADACIEDIADALGRH